MLERVLPGVEIGRVCLGLLGKCLSMVEIPLENDTMGEDERDDMIRIGVGGGGGWRS